MTTMKMYEFSQTRSKRALWAAAEAGVEVETVPVNVMAGDNKKPEYMEIHPHGFVPALTVDGDAMFESAAITLYLAEQYPKAKLAPAPGSDARRAYFQWAVYGPAEIDPHLGTLVPHTLLLPPDQRNADLANNAKEAFSKRAHVVSSALEGKRWLLGDQFTAADIVIGHDCAWARMLGVIDDYPVLCDYLSRLEDRPAFKKVWGGKVQRFSDPHAR